jgi:tetratricopeptide (TPR) repeat protein
MLDLRMACLNRRLGEVSALTQMFRGADSRVLQNSVVAVKSLGRVEACSDVESLVARVNPPSDVQVREQVAALHDRLSDARALELGGRYDEALREASSVEERAQALAYLPLEAEAHERLGAIWQAKGDYERSEAHLLQAIWAAEESRAEEVAADAWNRLVWVVGVEQLKPEQGRQWAQFARAALRRLGEDRFREATLTHNLGGVFYRQGDYEQAFAHYEAALEAQMEILGPEDPAVGRTLNHLGNVLIEKGDLERAFDYCRRSLRLREKVLGGRHPLVAASLNNMAAIRLRQERGEDALAFIERSREIVGGSEGPEELVACVLAGRIHQNLERHAEAAEAFHRVVELREALYGPQDARLVGDLRAFAAELTKAERDEDAIRATERADAIEAAEASKEQGEGTPK